MHLASTSDEAGSDRWEDAADYGLPTSLLEGSTRESLEEMIRARAARSAEQQP